MENVFSEIKDFNTEDKVRHVSLKIFSSPLFLLITFFYTLPVILNLITIILEFNLKILIEFILNAIIAFGFWKTYAMAKNGKVIDTSGLKVIKFFITLSLILIAIMVGLLVIYTIIAGFITFVAIIPLSIVGYAFYIFRHAIITAIASLEEGSLNTDYYSATITWIFVFMAIYSVSFILTLTFDPNSIPQLSDYAKEALTYTKSQKQIGVINYSISMLMYVLIIAFIRRLKFYLESIQAFFPKINNIQLDEIDYRISSNVLESDSQINDTRKYGEN